MAQLSGVPAAVENQQRIFISRQFALQFFKITGRDTDGRWMSNIVKQWKPLSRQQFVH